MKTCRSDIKRDKRKTYCKNSTLLGFSSATLKYGDFFLYAEVYTDGTAQTRLAKCHGRVRPLVCLDNQAMTYHVLAQVVSFDMRYTMERWISPEDIIETIPAERMPDQVKNLFVSLEEN